MLQVIYVFNHTKLFLGIQKVTRIPRAGHLFKKKIRFQAIISDYHFLYIGRKQRLRKTCKLPGSLLKICLTCRGIGKDWEFAVSRYLSKSQFYLIPKPNKQRHQWPYMEKNRDLTKLIIQNYIHYMITYIYIYIYICMYVCMYTQTYTLAEMYISDKRNSGYKWFLRNKNIVRRGDNWIFRVITLSC